MARPGHNTVCCWACAAPLKTHRWLQASLLRDAQAGARRPCWQGTGVINPQLCRVAGGGKQPYPESTHRVEAALLHDALEGVRVLGAQHLLLGVELLQPFLPALTASSAAPSSPG